MRGSEVYMEGLFFPVLEITWIWITKYTLDDSDEFLRSKRDNGKKGSMIKTKNQGSSSDWEVSLADFGGR